jgi:hypothetical protein
MPPDTFARAIYQVALCLSAIAVLRLCIVHLGARMGAILLGTPLIIFPLVAIQAWQGPEITADQTAGSIASMTAVSCALSLLRLPLPFTPLSILLTMATAWLAIISTIYLTALQAGTMTAILIANALYVLIRYRHLPPTLLQSSGKFTDGAAPITIFLVTFFMITRLVPDFIRGVLVSFPVGLVATLLFVRRLLPPEAFANFVIYTHGAITAGAVFVITMHFAAFHMSIIWSLILSLIASVVTSILLGRSWRART